MSSPARGLAVLVTRPRERADGLLRALEAIGARPIAWPTIAFEPLPAAAQRWPAAPDIAVFVSPAAVEHAAPSPEWFAASAIGAVGTATAAALRARGLAVDLLPATTADSEGLLCLPALAAERVGGRRVLIVRGEGGRALLGDTLVARGATVDYAAVYRRVCPAGGVPAEAAASDIVTLTSNQGVTHLHTMLDHAARERLATRPLAVASERTAERARSLGFNGPVDIAGGADDAALCAAVVRLARTHYPGTTP